MQLCQCLAVHLGLCHQHMLRYHRHILFLPHNFFYGTNEGTDGFGIVLCAVDEHLVAKVYDSVSVGHAYMTIVQDTAAHEVACQELSYLQYGTSCQSLICGHKCHLMWSDVRIGSNLVLYLLLFLVQGSTC